MKSQSKKTGLTLVELMVTISLIGLVIGIASSIFLGNNKVFKKGVDQYDVQSNARIAMTDVANSVRYVTFLEILPDTAVIPEADTLEDNEGYIYYDGSSGNIIRRTKSSNMSHTIGTADGSGVTFTSSANEYTIGVSIKGTDVNKKFEVASSILCLNMKLYSTSIGGSGTGSKLHYKKVIATPTVTASPTETPVVPPIVTPDSPVVDPFKITLTISYKINGTDKTNTCDLFTSTTKNVTSTKSIVNSANKYGDVSTIGGEGSDNITMTVKAIDAGFDMTLEVTLDDGSKCIFSISYNGSTWDVHKNI